MAKKEYIANALEVIKIEAEAVNSLTEIIDEKFQTACELLDNCSGRVVVLGVGKSGHIGKKIAATLSSTGTLAFYVNAAEASHGDFGMITKNDVVLAISYSGSTIEIINLLPLISKLDVKMISITGNDKSPLAKAAAINLNVKIEKEACPHNLAPTASTTATLVMGDALAIALSIAKGFSKQDFAFSHPGGALGKRLLLTVGDVMYSDDNIPIVKSDAIIEETILEITKKGLGMAIIVDNQHKLEGVYTDGDIRRSFERKVNLQNTTASQVMSINPKTVSRDMLAINALQIMEDFKITSLVVVDDKQIVVGIVHIHELLRSGIV